MAEIVFGAATSHSPLLAAPPHLWAERGDHDRHNRELYDHRGVIRSFDDLAADAGERFRADCTPQRWRQAWERSQKALDRLRDDFRRVAPDVVIIIGDDQEELFDSSNQPAMAISAAQKMSTGLMDDHDSEFLQVAARGYLMDQEFSFAGRADLARDLVGGLVQEGFDLAWIASTPEGTGFSGTPTASRSTVSCSLSRQRSSPSCSTPTTLPTSPRPGAATTWVERCERRLRPLRSTLASPFSRPAGYRISW